RSIQSKFIRKRQDVEDAKTTTDGSFPVLERVIGEANSRFEISGCRVARDKAVDRNGAARTVQAWRNTGRGAIRDRRNLSDPVIGIFGQSRKFIAQTQVQRQVRANQPIVLNIYAKKALAKRDFVGTS